MSEKKVAIIIPTYNSFKYIGECLWSAIQQDYGNIEIIVVDNDSDDPTFGKVEAIRSSYYKDIDYYNLISEDSHWAKEIKIDSAPNLYDYTWDEATRKGLEIMSDDVEYFMFLASDDKLDYNFVSNCMRIINSSKGKIKALQSYIRGFGAKNNTHGYTYKDLDHFKELCLERCPVNSPTIMWHTSVWEDGLMYSKPEEYAGAADYWMYCNQADNGLFIYPYPNCLGYNYRWNEDQATWGMHRDFKGIDKEIQEYWKEKWTKDKSQSGEHSIE